MAIGTLLLIVLVVTCFMFPFIRIMIGKMIKLITGQFLLQVHSEREVGVTMTQMTTEQMVKPDPPT